MIGIKGLHKFFNKGKQNEIHVINDVTLDLPERGMCAIFGKSGCGKTTLLNVIGGLDGFASGSLSIEGNNIAKNTDDIRNKYIGYIFQNYNLNKSESCFDNIAAALRLCGMKDEDEISRRVDAALRNVGMEMYSRRTPDTLSGGQQQRIAIARAIVKNPRIILADEPTGNLDEANTVMIMDLLSEIAKDHLVLLVTHEINLVDSYCNKIIELSDGKIVDIREGRADGSFSLRNKQDIYLGELEKREITSDRLSLEYYGDAPNEPLRLRVVNKDGRLYLELGTERVHIIDGTGEVRLINGKYEEKTKAETKSHINMQDLPEVNGEKFGSLFTFRSSVKSGYKANFVGTKKGKKALRRLLTLFALIIVLMSSVFGRAIGNLIDASDSYNHNMFYVYNKDEEVVDALNNAVNDPTSGIDEIRLIPYAPSSENTISFNSASFETFQQAAYLSGNYVNAAMLSTKLAEGKEILAGSGDLPSAEYVLISDLTADDIIENSTLGFIDEYSDLIGMTSMTYRVGDKSIRIGGVVKTGERAVYLSELTLATFTMQYGGNSTAKLASNFDLDVAEGKTVVVMVTPTSSGSTPYVGQTVNVSGVSLQISRIIKHYENYEKWLSCNKIQKQTRDSFFANLIKTVYPDISVGSDEYLSALKELKDQRYFEYDEYYYAELDKFMREESIVSPDDFNLWLYCEKGIEAVKYIYYLDEYSAAVFYKDTHGRYPTKTELDAIPKNDPNGIPSYGHKYFSNILLKDYYALYEQEFYTSNRDRIYTNSAIVGEKDYVDISKSVGKTSNMFVAMNFSYMYTAVHSYDTALTEKWLNDRFGHITDEFYEVIISPGEMFGFTVANRADEITGFVISMIVILAVMSVCMFFIMRSSMMNRIKEIGIYRAIGVSKRNLIFRFAIESFVLTALTVVVGYLITSGYIWLCIAVSPMVETIFFYPPWYSLIVLAFLVIVSILSGILPMMSLLRKTPSEILAKYDI